METRQVYLKLLKYLATFVNRKVKPMKKGQFDFKQFTIRHDKCAMKVGTDGVLLGAWTETEPDTRRILDIGTGSGLIAIMLAQKCNAEIIGVDIDGEAITQPKKMEPTRRGESVCTFYRQIYRIIVRQQALI